MEETAYIYLDFDGEEKQYEIIYDFILNDKNYIFIADAEKETIEEIHAFEYIEDGDNTHVKSIDDEDEWKQINEVYKAFVEENSEEVGE